MRLINKSFSQHLGWAFKKHWAVQNKRVPSYSGADKELQGNGNSFRVLTQELPADSAKIDKPSSFTDQSQVRKDRNGRLKSCYIYGNNNVLIGGIQQALRLTKSIEIRSLPKSIEAMELQINGLMHSNIKEALMTSRMFFADQESLPQDYVGSNERKISMLISKLLTECEKNAGRYITSQRRLVDLMNFKVTVPKHDSSLQLEINAQKIIMSSRPLDSIKTNCDSNVPDLHYISNTISLPKQIIYSDDASFSMHSKCCHPHTVFLYFDKNSVKNIHDGNVNISQFQSRNMLIAFSVAAARAKQLYGDAALNILPKPVVVQSIQTDGHTFHFGVFQLNTLQIDNSEGPKNYWFHKPNIDLFQTCKYSSGRPFLDCLNKDVFRYICAFYKNS